MVNTHVSAIDAAFPGVQPRLNNHAIELAVKTALALQGQVQKRSLFERKHYFYPDLPQGYQITQQREPISKGGFILLTENDGISSPVKIGIHQLQIEQDTGKSFHDMRPGETLLDLNRAGTGLMEIVTQPDIRSSYEAGLLVKKLQNILQWIGSSKANLEEGSMRCDVNVSVRRKGDKHFGTRCELKNLNRIRILSMAIDAEVRRQIEVLEKGGKVYVETRRYDEEKDTTFKLRDKETAPDYRYMPEPDLPPLILSQTYIDNIAAKLPELPDICLERIIKQYDLNLLNANLLLHEYKCVDYFEKVCQGRNPKIVANWTLNELSGALSSQGLSFQENPISIQRFGNLIDLVQNGTITGNTGKVIMKLMLKNPSDPMDIVKEKGLLKISDISQLKTLCEELTSKHDDKVKLIQNGDLKLFKWFIGRVMGRTKGLADPNALNQALSQSLGWKSYEDMLSTVEDKQLDKKKKNVL
ncbi:Glutamyl-tRNA amidotransferase B subunit [Cokeromyces recurvatus]|uniref:Glutamyl-tRNA amidotransferase B subunit n=1 Tax=Cokeromyces recurvatus TaxID=90255 RepID=UPI00221EA356|nr:Glutamyl-tRNA amidotransferase B subunit [Cokeromyces recurvatus]KAI7903225.1 Glutamyl-tRNA amidotransferase B subunit [Cokeromyces recurvatus]